MKPENNAPLHEKPDASRRQEWEWHFRTLRTLRERLMQDRDSQQQDAQQPRSGDTNDLADGGSDEFEHDLAFRLLSNEASALQEVDAALGRIEQGTYGICEETGKPIPEERLRAVPWTRYTKEVQERLERERAGR
jgi:RNA polymerase-binding protein DksA